MAKNKNTLGRLLAFTTTVAAVGGACYIFRDKIKQSPIYKASVDKACCLYDKFKDNFCKKNDDEDFFFDEEDADFTDVFSEDAKNEREYTSITINSKDKDMKEAASEEVPAADEPVTAGEPVSEETPAADESVFEETSAVQEPVSEETPAADEPASEETPVAQEPVSEETPKTADMTEIFPDDSIPTINFSNTFSKPEEVSGYENEGLSDVSEDPDVLEEQDKLDF